ncbi:MAG: DNA polymerase III subunit delta [Clostridia bacterium]|nr:DNA polymerase III subunit delta [Clostridia bacterium]
MKFVDFKKSLIELIEPVYIFYGEDRYLIDTCIKNLTTACEISLPELNLSIFDANADINEVLTACETLPFLDKMRLILLKDIELNEDKRKKLIEYAKNPNKSVCLAISIKGETKEMENITLVDCEKLDANMIRKKVLSDLKPKGFLISDEALKVLISYCDYNLTQIYSELEKLMAYATEHKVITEDMIKTLSVKDVSYNIFELTESLGNKDTEHAINTLNYLLKDEDPIAIIGLLYGYFRRLLIVAMTPAEVDNANIANSLQIKPYAITLARKQCKLFGAKKLYDLCDKLQKIDLKAKTNFCNVENELYSFVFSALN